MLIVVESSTRRDTSQTDQAVSRPVPFATYTTWRPPAVPVAENPRFDVHPDLCPIDLFPIQLNSQCSVPSYRFINKGDPKQMLLFIDGAALGNGTPDARAGWAVYGGPQIISKGRLDGVQTNNRAELRAAIAAVCLRPWRDEGFTSVVLATDSKYVVKGFCEYLPRWKHNWWRASAGTQVVNMDLWAMLDETIELAAKRGSQVLFWWIPRRLNVADNYAKEAANLPAVEKKPERVCCF